MQIKNKEGRVIDELCNTLPRDDELEHITFDIELLKRAVFKKRRLGLKEYPSIEEVLSYDDKWQWQCEKIEQTIDAGVDSHKLPAHMKGGGT